MSSRDLIPVYKVSCADVVCAALTILVLMHDKSHNAAHKTRKQCAYHSTFNITHSLCARLFHSSFH